ncbi:MAG: HAMP domain-containing sensor histidine kinase, partial [Minisyncoccia bacterium]
KILKRIYLSAERPNNITNDMLDALEIEGGLLKFQFTDASVKEIIKETIDTLKPNYDEKGIYVKFLPEKDVPETIKVEPNYIRQVFMNVIDNACKYTREGGVEIFLKNNEKYVDIVVKDTGVGVSEEDQKRLFEKFTRGKNAIKENASGSGLGLFIAKKIVEKHHGKMKFYSGGVGKGSTVTISLLAEK